MTAVEQYSGDQRRPEDHDQDQRGRTTPPEPLRPTRIAAGPPEDPDGIFVRSVQILCAAADVLRGERSRVAASGGQPLAADAP